MWLFGRMGALSEENYGNSGHENEQGNLLTFCEARIKSKCTVLRCRAMKTLHGRM